MATAESDRPYRVRKANFRCKTKYVFGVNWSWVGGCLSWLSEFMLSFVLKFERMSKSF